ncbi:MAG: DUF4070 domain-containing protein [Caldimicrobium sp.]|jgi:radical SAM superfamily enzyme YgiQ (UPF0313 family)|nr:DUF4070 domain-containing protein [Caldimicrobium sp.]
MKALLIYPRYPDTFWSFRHALKFLNKAATHPPLGLLTIASLLPQDWELKLVDLNVSPLEDKDLAWADLVLVSAMAVQRESAEEVIKRAKGFSKKVVAGGPLFTVFYQDFWEDVDHFVLNEGEITLPQFLSDLAQGNPKKLYTTQEKADLKKSPIPRYDLIDFKSYTSMCIQFSRGCPFNCEFCDVTNLFGHAVRTKSKEQILNELENLYQLGWRGSVFFVDDNFIGPKRITKEEILPAIIEWQKKRNHPFYFYTQVSINLADDDELIRLMTEAGFTSVFIGIETPNEESLKEANKRQNINRDLVSSIRKVQKSGLEVMGGFILGFDNDPPTIFDTLVRFIEDTRIIIAMVGVLNAPPGTRLYHRLLEEGRILSRFIGNNTDISTNIIPKMGFETLIEGYKKVIRELYSVKNYYRRVSTFLDDYSFKAKFSLSLSYLKYNYGYLLSIPKILFHFGFREKGRSDFWKLLWKTISKKPKAFSTILAQVVSGYHFRQIFKEAF